MDHSARSAALKTAKALIGSHGLVAHMNKYNLDQLAREVHEDTTGFRVEFHLDPKASAWSDHNPSCTLLLNYVADPKGSHLADDKSIALDSHLNLRVGSSSNDMTLETLRRRESMISLLGMLCEMLSASLPAKVTSVIETPAEHADRTQRAMEQTVGQQIFAALGAAAFKGLRKNGSQRSFRLSPIYSSPDGKYPGSGTYRFRHVRSTDSRGRPRDVVHYSIRVYGSDGSSPPSGAIRRVDPVQS